MGKRKVLENSNLNPEHFDESPSEESSSEDVPNGLALYK